MAEFLEGAKDVAPYITPFINALIETHLKPKLSSLLSRGLKDPASAARRIERTYHEYLERSYIQHAYLVPLALPNQRRTLEDLYVPLTVRIAGERGDIKVDCYESKLIPHHRKILLTDTAGMGKTTLLRFLFGRCILENAGIPIFVELRKLSKEKTLIDYIAHELTAIDAQLDIDLIKRLVRRGDFVFFLDGYDEIHPSCRKDVTEDIVTFIGKSGHNDFIMTSRPDASLSTFGGFWHASIKPMNVDEAHQLIRKYDQYSELSDQLIRALHSDKSGAVSTFLKNPLLVSLLYRAYCHKQVLPTTSYMFYRQVFEALYDRHDLTKGPFIRPKNSGLHLDAFHQVLRALGYISYRSGELEQSCDKFLKLIRQARDRCTGLTFSESDFLRDVTESVPLFVIDGSYYRWAHKSFQEYFAAAYIYMDMSDQKETALKGLCHSDITIVTHFNLLSFYYDMDYSTFCRTLIQPILADYFEYIESSYDECRHPEVSAKLLKERRQLTFGGKVQYLYSDFTHRADELEPKAQHVMDHGGIFRGHGFPHPQSFAVRASGKSYLLFVFPEETRTRGLISFLSYMGDPLVSPVRRTLLNRNEQAKLVAALGRLEEREHYCYSDDPKALTSDPASFEAWNSALRLATSTTIEPKRAHHMLERLKAEAQHKEEDALMGWNLWKLPD